MIDSLFKVCENSEISEEMNHHRRFLVQAFIEGMNYVMPSQIFKQTCSFENNELKLAQWKISRDSFQNILVLSAGKAAADMLNSLRKLLPSSVPLNAISIVPENQRNLSTLQELNEQINISIYFGGHPIPTQEGVEGVNHMLQMINQADESTLILLLISGGASALMPMPANGITLDDLQIMNKILLHSGANIHEINSIRKHLSQIKGGQLAEYIHPFHAYCLIISDVVGDKLDVIASGPTAPDPSTFSDALWVCKKYHLLEIMPKNVLLHLKKGEMGYINETPKASAPCFRTIHNHVIGSVIQAANRIKDWCEEQGIICKIVSTNITGEARKFGRTLTEEIASFHAIQYPAVFIGTGELTVTIQDNGIGGPNQEMLLSFLHEMTINPTCGATHGAWVILAASFDGKEGNSPALGAIIDTFSLRRIRDKGLDLSAFLKKNDSYHLFEALQDALISGPTGTGTNDIYILLRLRDF